jgi:hypothetical protein
MNRINEKLIKYCYATAHFVVTCDEHSGCMQKARRINSVELRGTSAQVERIWRHLLPMQHGGT